MAGGTSVVADKQLIADIGTLTGETVDTEVVRVIESPGIPRIHGAMKTDFFGDSGWILADVFGDLLKGKTVIECLFNVFTVF